MKELKLVKVNFRKFVQENFGINKHLVYKLLGLLGFNCLSYKIDFVWKCITELDFIKLIAYIEDCFLIGSYLRDKIYFYIRKYKVVKSYRGSRHIYGLPTNGQRTKTNARTRKNSRKKFVLKLKGSKTKKDSKQNKQRKIVKNVTKKKK